MVQLSRNKGIVCSNTRASKAQQTVYPVSGNNWGIGERKKLELFTDRRTAKQRECLEQRQQKNKKISLSEKTPGHVFERWQLNLHNRL